MELLSSWELYWLLKLDTFRKMFGIIIMISGFVPFLVAMITEEWGSVKTSLKYAVPIAGISMLLAFFLPSTKQMAVIMVLPPIINSEKVQSIPPKLLDILGLSLDNMKDILQDKKD